MKNNGSTTPAIKKGWLRTLLYLILIIVPGTIAIGIYAFKFPNSQKTTGIFQLLQSGAITLIFFVLTLLATYIFRRWIDRKNMVSLGLQIAGHFHEAITGGLLAIFIVCLSSMILKTTGNLKWMDIIFDPRTLFLSLGGILISAFYQELIFRGYVLTNLLGSFPPWLSILVSSLLFVIFQWNGISSGGFFAMINNLILGGLLGLNYYFTRNLWFSVFFHAAWKLFEGPLLGFPGSDTAQPLLQASFYGDENITGGANGLEGSYIFLVISLLSLIAMYLILQKKFNQQFLPVPNRI
jgi:uncharacterized protein